MLETKGSIEYTDTEASHYDRARVAAVWRKMDWVVLPVVTMIYFLSSLDRSNIGNARIAGLQKELHMSDYQYTVALTATLVTYTLIDIPSNLVLKAVGPRLMVPTMVILWGLTCTLQGVVHNYAGLVVARLFLGLFEGGLLPAISLYLSSFYPRRQLQLRIAIMFSATSIASAFSGLLAAAILKMNGVGSRPGWAWLFILEGLFTILFGLSAYFLLPNTPTSSPRFTAEEKQIILQTLREDGIISGDEKDETYTKTEFLRTFFQPHVLLIMLAGFMNGSTLSGLAYFLPSIVASLGYAGTHAQLMSVPPFAVSAVLSVATAFFSDRYGRRGLTIIFFATIALAGFSVFYASFVNHVRYGSLFLLVPGTYCIGPPLGTWMANNSAPLIRRATALALLPVMTNMGSILSTWLLGSISPAPRYTSATITLLVFQIGIMGCAALNVAWLSRENARKARERLAAGDGKHEIVGAGNDSIWFEYVL
ncbi:MFS general substrate transporter [Trametes versicolor FP-101664 SS1]|uniref:MFS general substrate transporter n=1 Tax=Trametes versicolor (strain FP-101664) TaxID=717944 RepID=UPI00046240E2|nr:MFS general substrate transporter [Trametes versicolor FP-101664 SS1]EIW55358.1 MFS general substrate transporter [Trametes versicolor FP-101664 SS1]